MSYRGKLEPTAQLIWNWVRQAERDHELRNDGGMTTAERDEIVRLRRKNQRLRQERDILAKAAASYPQESRAAPGGSSGP